MQKLNTMSGLAAHTGKYTHPNFQIFVRIFPNSFGNKTHKFSNPKSAKQSSQLATSIIKMTSMYNRASTLQVKERNTAHKTKYKSLVPTIRNWGTKVAKSTATPSQSSKLTLPILVNVCSIQSVSCMILIQTPKNTQNPSKFFSHSSSKSYRSKR